MDRWVKHYLELYSEETEVAQTPIDDLPRLPIMHELDAEPTIDELGKVRFAVMWKSPRERWHTSRRTQK